MTALLLAALLTLPRRSRRPARRAVDRRPRRPGVHGPREGPARPVGARRGRDPGARKGDQVRRPRGRPPRPRTARQVRLGHPPGHAAGRAQTHPRVPGRQAGRATRRTRRPARQGPAGVGGGPRHPREGHPRADPPARPRAPRHAPAARGAEDAVRREDRRGGGTHRPARDRHHAAGRGGLRRVPDAARHAAGGHRRGRSAARGRPQPRRREARAGPPLSGQRLLGEGPRRRPPTSPAPSNSFTRTRATGTRCSPCRGRNAPTCRTP